MYLTYGTFDFHQFDYTSYVDKFCSLCYNSTLLNDRFILTRPQYLLPHFNIASDYFNMEKLFVKPNSSMKPFDAAIMDGKQISGLREFFMQMPLDDLIFLCPARDDIKMEFRFVIIDGSVITGSQYQPIVQHHSCCEQGRFAGMYAGATALRLKDTIRAKAYTIDVAVMNDDELRVVEINSFNCAGLYDCNLNWIVEELSC